MDKGSKMILNNIFILDLSRVLAGPFATMFLADLGAKVVKVEPPEGDETRLYSPLVNGVSAYFYSVNRGKKSISINLKKEEGKRILYKLVEKADVVIHNYRDEIADKLGISYKQLIKYNDRIICCTIRGYDRNSSYKDRHSYDLIIQGESGLMMSTGHEGDPPVRVGFALTDIFAGLYCASTILACLLRGKRPSSIEVNLFDSMIYSMSYLAYIYLFTGISPGRYGSGHPSIVPYQAFLCRDNKYIVVAAPNNKIFKRLCNALNLENLLDDPRFLDNNLRYPNPDFGGEIQRK